MALGSPDPARMMDETPAAPRARGGVSVAGPLQTAGPGLCFAHCGRDRSSRPPLAHSPRLVAPGGAFRSRDGLALPSAHCRLPEAAWKDTFGQRRLASAFARLEEGRRTEWALGCLHTS